jgi:hypothetical protein
VAHIRDKNAYKIWIGKSQEKVPLGAARHKWEDNIKMDLKKIGCGLD